MTNTYQQLLSCWHKMEHFTPATVKLNEVEKLNARQLPWIPPKRSKNRDKRIVHLVYLGVFASAHVTGFVKEYFKDKSEEVNSFSANYCFASLKLDEEGIYIEETLGISTLPWALGQLEKGRLANNDWRIEFEKFIKNVLLAIIDRLDGIQSYDSLSAIQSEIMQLSGWSGNPEVNLYFKTEEVFRKKKKKKKQGEEDEEEEEDIKADLLNSFFIEDLEKIIADYENTQKLPSPLDTYIKANINEVFPRKDLKSDSGALKEQLRPARYPDGYHSSLTERDGKNTKLRRID